VKRPGTALVLAMPVIAGVLGARVRVESRAAGTGGSGLGTSAVVVAGMPVDLILRSSVWRLLCRDVSGEAV